MAIETTLYVHEETLRLIEDASALTDSRRNKMIVLLMKKAMRDLRRGPRTGSAVRYQGRDRKDRWHTVHVRCRDDEADYFRDLRNFFKQSVSLILACATREYLHDIIRKSQRGEKPDNYPFVNYVLSREVAEGLIFWKICWGFPLKPEKYFRL